MTSEIRANTIKNRVGLGTVSYTNTGIVVSGIVTANTVRLSDDNKIQLGDGQDIEVYHDGSYSYLQAQGTLFIDATGDINFRNPNNGEYKAAFNNNGPCSLLHNGQVKFATTSTGINVTGSITGTGDLTLTDTATDSSAGPEFKLFRNSASPADADYLGQIKFAGESDTGVERNYAKITGKILDASNGTEDGILEFAHIKGGSQNISARFRSDSLQLLNDTNLSVAGDTTLTGDLDVDGHTNLDNVNIVGVTTTTDNLHIGTRTHTANSSTALKNIHMGSEFWNGTAGDHRALKLIFYGTSGSAGQYGLGVSNNTLELQSNFNISMFAGGVSGNTKTRRFHITSAGDYLFDTGTLYVKDKISHYDDADTNIRFSTSDTISFETAGAERLRILSSGELRIISSGNNNDPAHLRLHSADVSISTNDAIGVVRFAGRDAGSASVSRTGALIQATAAATWDTLQSSGYSATHLDFFTQSNSGTDNIAAGARLRLDSDGRLLLGRQTVSHTSSKMEIQGGAEAYLRISPNTNTGVSGIIFGTADDHSTGGIYYQGTDDALIFAGYNNDEKMRITAGGLIQAKTLSGSYYPIASEKDGSTSARAATSAWEIKKTLGPRAKTGYYYLENPYDGSVNTWWCDMTTDGGGWILIAHTGEGQMSSLATGDGNHWFNRSNKGGFDSVGSGYYKGGGYWRATNGAWAANTCGQLMWDVRVHNQFGYQQYGYHDTAESASKVVFNWGTDQALPNGASSLSNIPNASNRRFNEWCYEVQNAPGFNPSNYHQNIRSNTINGANFFTEHMVMTWSFRNTGGAGDAAADGPYWMIGSHHDGQHQHYEESLSGSDGVYGDGGYQVVSNQDTYWANNPSGTNNGMRRLAKFDDSGTVNVWLR